MNHRHFMNIDFSLPPSFVPFSNMPYIFPLYILSMPLGISQLHPPTIATLKPFFKQWFPSSLPASPSAQSRYRKLGWNPALYHCTSCHVGRHLKSRIQTWDEFQCYAIRPRGGGTFLSSLPFAPLHSRGASNALKPIWRLYRLTEAMGRKGNESCS